MPSSHAARMKSGLLYALLAYGLWGLLPIVFKWMSAIPVWVVLVHRILWTFVFTALLVTLGRKLGQIGSLLQQPRTLGWLALSGALIGLNWLIFVWAVVHDRILETSLGYYITPLVNVLLGLLFLGEHIHGRERLALGLATAGTGWLVLGHGSLPWVALALAASFSFYGLIRKRLGVGALPGLMLESGFLLPLALAALPWLDAPQPDGFVQGDALVRFQLVALGVITTVPLAAFAAATRRLPLSLVGMMQYLAPTLTLLLAVGLYGESFSRDHAISFGLIWAGLALYSHSLWQKSRQPAAYD